MPIAAAPPVPRWNRVAIAFMAVVHGLAALGLLLPIRASWAPVAFAVYVILGLGTTVGLHRLICHRAFQCPRWVEYALVTMAMPTGQGSPLLWAATHRRHHGFADGPRDPHTPRRGFWYAHIGWIVDDNSTEDGAWETWCRDIAGDRYYRWLMRWRLVPQAISVLVAALVLGWAAVPFCFFLPAVLWMHSTYAVNSLCHLPGLGSAPWATAEGSRNFWLVGVLALGEGWHNNHHAFPRAARHGLRWWQIDVSWLFIRGLAALGLAWDSKQPGRHVATAAPQAFSKTKTAATRIS